MSQLKVMRQTGGKELVSNMDKTLCDMIVTQWSKLMHEGIDVMADVAQEIVDVNDSDDKKEYIDLLDTVGQSAGVWQIKAYDNEKLIYSIALIT